MALSKRVGSGHPAVYEVIEQGGVECWDCGEFIPVGSFFTRHKVRGGGGANYAFCADCEPILMKGMLWTGRPAPEPTGYTGSPPKESPRDVRLVAMNARQLDRVRDAAGERCVAPGIEPDPDLQGLADSYEEGLNDRERALILEALRSAVDEGFGSDEGMALYSKLVTFEAGK